MYDRDGFIPTLIGAVAGLTASYLVDTWQKKVPGNVLPTVVHTGVGVAALAGRNWARSAWLYELLEAVGYGAFGRLGTFIAANTTTLGGIKPMNPPMVTVKTSLAMARAAAAEVVPFPPQPQPVMAAADRAVVSVAPSVSTDLGFESEI